MYVRAIMQSPGYHNAVNLGHLKQKYHIPIY